MSKILTVFGASGNQGGSVVRTVLADPALSTEFKIRAVTRDESKAVIKEFAKQGVEIVKVSDRIHETNKGHVLIRFSDRRTCLLPRPLLLRCRVPTQSSS